MPPASTKAAATDAVADTRLSPGVTGYRRMSLALFAAGVATFALLYSTQALLPAVSDYSRQLFERHPELVEPIVERWLPNRDRFATV